MEEKDVNSIASAVTAALGKLNADTAAQAAKEKEKNNTETSVEVFKCPECGTTLVGGISYCQSCGCPLEWET